MIIDKFGITQQEYQAIEETCSRLEKLGYFVPDVIVKIINHAQGVAGSGPIYLNPNTNIEELVFCLRHEIGHRNDPSVNEPCNVWDDEELIAGNWVIKAEEFANDFARKTAN